MGRDFVSPSLLHSICLFGYFLRTGSEQTEQKRNGKTSKIAASADSWPAWILAYTKHKCAIARVTLEMIALITVALCELQDGFFALTKTIGTSAMRHLSGGCIIFQFVCEGLSAKVREHIVSGNFVPILICRKKAFEISDLLFKVPFPVGARKCGRLCFEYLPLKLDHRVIECDFVAYIFDAFGDIKGNFQCPVRLTNTYNHFEINSVIVSATG